MSGYTPIATLLSKRGGIVRVSAGKGVVALERLRRPDMKVEDRMVFALDVLPTILVNIAMAAEAAADMMDSEGGAA